MGFVAPHFKGHAFLVAFDEDFHGLVAVVAVDAAQDAGKDTVGGAFVGKISFAFCCLET